MIKRKPMKKPQLISKTFASLKIRVSKGIPPPLSRRFTTEKPKGQECSQQNRRGKSPEFQGSHCDEHLYRSLIWKFISKILKFSFAEQRTSMLFLSHMDNCPFDRQKT